MLYNNEKYSTIEFAINREGVFRLHPIRYFIINKKTDIMHIYGYCQQTKSRSVPIRLFDTVEELEAYAGRKLRLCKDCEKKNKI